MAISGDGSAFLVSTSGYPIGDLIEEFDVAAPLRIKKIFQPHVPSEPTTGAAYGDAGYVGMDEIVFTAASEGKNGGNFDYNVYRMNDVTGGEITQLTNHGGMIDKLEVEPNSKIWMSANGQWTAVENPPER